MIFEIAKLAAPTILFIDEAHSIMADNDGPKDDGAIERVRFMIINIK